MIKQCSIHGLLTSMLLIVFSLMSNDAIAQKAIRGTVLDEANEPIIGASVLVKGTTNGSITGVDGSFNVKANPSDVLVISYVGYATVEQQVGNQTQLVIHLREDSKVLNDVVVIGYGSTTKKELTGSVTSMKKDDLNPGTFTNAMGMLQGKVAGLQIINPNGADPTAKYEVLLRGTNTLSAGQGPLIIIDGVAGADIRNINFQEVESIDVLKDGSAAAIYGTRGTNGVIIVTTKRARSGKTEVSYDGSSPWESFHAEQNLYRQANTNLLSRSIAQNWKVISLTVIPIGLKKLHKLRSAISTTCLYPEVPRSSHITHLSIMKRAMACKSIIAPKS